jgi:hypothetical protein
MTMDFEWAIRTLLSIQIGTPASARERAKTALAFARRGSVCDDPYIDTPSFGLHQRLDNLRTRGEAVRTDKYLLLSTVNGVDRQSRAVLLGEKHTATATPVPRDETGTANESAPSASDRAGINTFHVIHEIGLTHNESLFAGNPQV